MNAAPTFPTTLVDELWRVRRRWLVTGVAGFIGSHLLETLLALDQEVVGLDDLSTGSRANLEDVRARAGEKRWESFRFHHADIRSLEATREAARDVDVILHQAALGSVPRSIENPLETHSVNVLGTVNVLEAARHEGRPRVVYASSSAVYGDDSRLPKVEDRRGRPLSPYAASKVAGELAADAHAHSYGLEVLGLRYFNVFGPRQRPDGPYAAVVPRWIEAFIQDHPVVIYGDGRTSRDFCYVANTVQANLLAALTREPGAVGSVVNVAVGGRTSLTELFEKIRRRVARVVPRAGSRKPVHEPFRPGDVPHSEADISRAERLLGYRPSHDLERGLDETVAWFLEAVGTGSIGV
ncbi:MAG: SDR family oxidoreductase [Gemmatimonadota bacterium]